MTRISVPAALLSTGDYNAYNESNEKRKNGLHSKGKTFLKALAAELGLGPKDYDLRSNLAGIAVSGEVTLHGDHIYVQIAESCIGPRGLSVLFRGCKNRKDYSGYSNNHVSMSDFNTDQERLIARVKREMEIAKEKATA